VKSEHWIATANKEMSTTLTARHKLRINHHFEMNLTISCPFREGQIRAFINGWNDRCQPFVWTKTADQILKKADRKTTSVAVH
jgi:hypothetical protein